MKFIIDRATDWGNTEKPPMDGAYFDEVYQKWFIDINSLEELMSIEPEYGVVISHNPLHITIYDGYIE